MFNNIRQIRKNIFRMTQSDFAFLAGVTQATVSRWENDEIAAEPALSGIKAIREAAIARGLAWDDNFLFSWPDDIPRPEGAVWPEGIARPAVGDEVCAEVATANSQGRERKKAV